MKTLIMMVSLLAAASLANAQVDFDRGADVGSLIKEASAEPVKLPEARYGIPAYSSRDCKKVEFTAESPLTSPDISLSSMQMFQDCQNYGSPVGQICANRPEYYSETTRVTVTAPRELKPGQKETFEVCLWGQFLQIRPVETVYKYKSKVTFEGIFLTPQGLIAPKAETKAAPGDFCRLAMDTQYACVYSCPNGQYVTQQKPLPDMPAPNPWAGPMLHPCRPGIPAPQSFSELG